MTGGLQPRMAAVRGAIGFLSLLPVGHDESAFQAFQLSPWTFPLVGYLLGVVFALPFVLPSSVPVVVIAAIFLVIVVLATGVNHFDGLADLGDAWAVHGGREDRVSAMKDTTLGVGGALALIVALVVLALAAFGYALASVLIVGVVVAVEVGAKLGLAMLACLGEARHEGLGSALTAENGLGDLILPILLALPATALSWPLPAAGAALFGAVIGALAVWSWARARLGGVSGDVFGAANEIARLTGLHVGLAVWFLT